MAAATPSRGRIVWVELTDPQGRNPKTRPAVIVTATGDIKPDGTVVVVAVSSQVDASPPDVQVELPWANGGHPRTRLKERCAAVCTWLAEVPVSAIQRYGGTVPAAQMLRIIALLESLEEPDEGEEPNKPAS